MSSKNGTSIRVSEPGVEPFGSRFLSAADLRHIGGFKDDILDRSLSSWVLSPIAQYLSRFIPASLAPNVLTLMSLVCVLHACHFTYMYHSTWPVLTAVLTIVMFSAYVLLDLVDGKHARNIQNDTPLGYAFNAACDAVSVTFITLTMCLSMNLQDLSVMWYVVQIANMLFIWQKLSALCKGFVSYGLFTGPGEAFLVFNLLLLVRAYFGLDWVYRTCSVILTTVVTRPTAAVVSSVKMYSAGLFHYKPAAVVMDYLSKVARSAGSDNVAQQVARTCYYGLLVIVVFKCITQLRRHGQQSTSNYMCFSLLYRAVPSFIWAMGNSARTGHLTIHDVIADGLFMSIITTDLVISRMAKRQLHDWIPIMAMVSTFDKLFTIFLCVFYYGSIFFDMATFLNLPVFTPVVNVYIDGVFDLCHLGHKNHIKRALNYGNRVFVGVMSDEDVCKYKRRPIMTLEERCAEVEALSCVYRVIPGAPCFGLTEEFLRQYKIHVVLASPEYDKPDDKYYAVPRRLGLLKWMPRTDGVSTSDIIKRIRDQYSPTNDGKSAMSCTTPTKPMDGISSALSSPTSDTAVATSSLFVPSPPLKVVTS